MTCPRSITFTMAGTAKSPSVVVTVTENGGKLDFSLALSGPAGTTADMRGLFFDLADDSKLAGLKHSANALITDFDTVNVIDLGNGANMNGEASSFDAGLEFGTQGIAKDDIKQMTFTLSNTANNLTLDDIAHMDFGVRLTNVGAVGGPRNDIAKLTLVAPAAPDARDDSYSMFEDGQAGLNSPADTPKGLLMQVLGNDTDADGQKLTITHIEGVQHGTVQIVDGDDADTLAGDAILYTPDADYAGSDSFTYCVSGGHGGTDSAKVNVGITAVADKPMLDVKMMAGDTVNEIRFVVTATQTDNDGSEFIDRIEVLGLPAGATLTPSGMNPGDQPGQIVQEFVLTLPSGQDSKFDLSFQAVSREQSNGDEQTASQTFKIEIEHRHQEATTRFDALDQSEWSSGDSFSIHTNDFYGVQEDAALTSEPDATLVYDFAAGYKLGFTQKIDIEGGDIDASIDYDVTVDATHNKTLDVLEIATDADITGGGFMTSGPQAAYHLDFSALLYLSAYAGLNIVDVLSVALTPPVDISLGGTYNIVDFDTQDLSYDIDSMGLQAHLGWPDLIAHGNAKSLAQGQFEGLVDEQIMNMNFDVDSFLTGGTDALKLELSLLGGALWGTLDLIDLDITGSASILQNLLMDEQKLTGILHFEDGTDRTFTMGETLKFEHASEIDKAGDNDGTVEYTLELLPTVQLSNLTQLQMAFNLSYDVLKAAAGYDVVVASGSVHETAFHLSAPLVNEKITLWNESFELKFKPEMVDFAA